MSEDANDVSKALAAFGAPSIRYHSFGQATVKPTGIAAPRRPAATALPPTGSETETYVVQPEPVAAPEPVMQARLAPTPVVAPRPSPVFREPATMRPAPLFPPAATVAPPPRPLAEWAAPVAPPPVRPPVVPPVQITPAVAAAPIEASIPAPAPYLEPRPVPALMPDIQPGPAPVNFQAAPLVAAPVPNVVTRRSPSTSSSSNLVDVFEFLAAS